MATPFRRIRGSHIPKEMNIYILCGNAAYNKGDRGNLDTQINRLRKAYPLANITVDSYRPEIDRCWYNARFVQRGLLLSLEQIRALSKSDIVIWGGGALIADNSCRILVPMWLLIIGFVRFILRKPIIAWAHGVVLETKLAKFLASHVYNWVDIITVRDQNSYDALNSLPRIKPKIHKTMDLAILLNPKGSECGTKVLRDFGHATTKSKRLIAISPTYWPLYHNKYDVLPLMLARKLPHRKNRNQRKIRSYNKSLSDLCCRLVKEYQAEIMLLPRYPCEPWRDVEYLKQVRELSGCPENVMVFDRDDYSPSDYLSIYHHCDLVITTALHDAIFATALDRPCVVLYYEPKGKDFFEALHSTDRMLDWNVLFEPGGTEKVMDVVRHTLQKWPEIKQGIVKRKELLQESAHRNFHFLDQLIQAYS